MTQRKRVEGLDWMDVELILNPDLGGSPELYTALLTKMLEYLPDVDPYLEDTIHDEAMRRIEAKEMPRAQAECYLEALERSAEETDRQINNLKREINNLKRVLKHGPLRVVK